MKADAWFRAYTRVIDNAKMQTMDAELFRQLFNYWCLAKLNGGILPPSSEIAWRLRRPVEMVEADIKALSSAPLKLLQRDGKDLFPTEWEEWQTKVNTSAERMAEKRLRDGVAGGKVTVKRKQSDAICDTESDGDVTANVTESVTSCDGKSDAHVTKSVTQRREEKRREEQQQQQRATREPDFLPFDGPDPAQLVADAVEECAQFWPNVGDKPDAIAAWQREAAGDPRGVAEWCRAVIATARQHAPAQKAAKAADGHHFIPHLKRWVTRRDYTSPPPTVIRQERGPRDLGENYDG